MKKLVIISSFIFLIMQMGCIKKDFNPPKLTNVNDAEYLSKVNTTIAELRSWMPTDGSFYKVPDDANWVIQGVVISSDRNGNFYKCIHIQDATAGIQLLIDGSGLYATYPMGMRVFVKLAGLGLTAYNNQLELGMFDKTSEKVINIPIRLTDNYIVKGSLNNAVDTLKISDFTNLSSNYQSRLVKLGMVKIADEDVEKTLGDLVSQSSSYAISVDDARKNTMNLTTSAFANFANEKAPKGAGYILGVYTQYKTDNQIAISSYQDIVFDANAVLTYNTEIPSNYVVKKISEVRSWKGTTARYPIDKDTAIQGIVISDNSFGNMPDSQLFIQDPNDNNSAICVFLNKKANNIKFKHGDEVVINLNGAVLTTQNAGKVIASFAATHGANGKDPSIILLGENKPLDPVVVNLDDLNTDLNTDNPIHEAQLIKIQNGHFGSRQGLSFSGNIYLAQKDYNAQFISYTKTGYTGGNIVPNGLCNVMALIVKYYGGYELVFRMPTDIEDLHLDAPTTPLPAGCALYEDFDIKTVGSYTGSSAQLNSGEWFVMGSSNMDANDHFVTGKSIRMRANSSDLATNGINGGNVIQMNFDKADGIGSVKFKYGSYANHSGGIVFVEYSTDQGISWTKANPTGITALAFTAMQDADIPVNISTPVRIRIIKYSQSGSTSVNIDNICIGDFGATPTTATPTFTPPAGTYTATQSVTIACSTPLAEIYYSLTGTPTIGSPGTLPYSVPIPITATTTIKAIAHMADGSLANSAVATAVYTINPPTNPAGCALYEDFEDKVWAGTSYASRTVTDAVGQWTVAAVGTMDANDHPDGVASRAMRLRGTTGDACLVQMNFDKADGIGSVKFKYGSYSSHSNGKVFVEYSTDQGANWTRIASSATTAPSFTAMQDADIPVNISTPVRIRIIKDNQSGSTSVNIDNICISDYVPTAATPTFTPMAGTYIVATQITLNTTTPGANIYYTLNGTNPIVGNAATLDYATNPIILNAGTTTIKAIAVDGSGVLANSSVASATYTIQAPGMVQTPTLDKAAGTYTGTQSVTISCTTSSSTIYYTTNGDDPADALGSRQTIASGSAVSITKNTTLRVIAEASGMTTSSEVSATYTIKVPTPTFTPSTATTVTSPATISVTIACTDASAVIHYTDDGSTPTESSPVYSSAITVSSTKTFKAIAVQTGMTNSNMATSPTYTISATGSETIQWDVSSTATTVVLPISSNGGSLSGGTLDLANIPSGNTNAIATTVGSKSFWTGYWGSGTTLNSQYWLIKTPSVTASNMTIDYKAFGASTGPKDMRIQYSIDNGATWIGDYDYTITKTTNPGDAINKTWSIGVTSHAVWIKIYPTTTTTIGGGAMTAAGSNRIETPLKITFN